MKKERIDSINLLRAIAAVAVFLYHAYWNIGCRYGVLDVWIEQSFVWMTLFFVLSGVVLRYNYSDVKFGDAATFGKYFGKRVLSIFPLYFLIQFVYMLINISTNIREDIITFPYQALLFQEFAHYPYLTNGGTWFFSSIFMCYLLFPYFNTLASVMTKKQAVAGAAILLVLLGFTPYIGLTYNVDLYNNAFIRIFEFALGVCLVKIIETTPKVLEKISGNRFARKIWILVLILFMAGIYALQKIPAVDNYPAYLNAYSGVACMILLYTFIACKDKLLNAISNNRVIKFLSNYSLELWCATFFTTSLAMYYLRYIGAEYYNLKNIIISAVINLVIAVLLKAYTKVAKKLIEKFKAKKIIIMVLFVCLVYLGIKICINYGPRNTYDFQNDYITADNMEGVYHDEGEYAWINKDFKVEFNKKAASQIIIKAATSVDYLGDNVNTAIYVNGIFIQDIVVTGELQEFVINIPDGIISRGEFEVRMLSDKSFVPAEIITGANDTRELAIRLYSIGCK